MHACGEGACSRWAAQRPWRGDAETETETETETEGALRAPTGARSLATGVVVFQ
jgi:hypothetical protein